MRKISMFVTLLLFTLLLNGCSTNKNDSRIDPFVNQEENTKEEILTSLHYFDTILSDYHFLQPNWEISMLGDFEDTDYPINKEDIATAKNRNYWVMGIDGDTGAKEGIKTILDNYDYISTLEENQPTLIKSNTEEEIELIIAINDKELYFELYSHNEYEVEAQYVHISFIDDKLILSTSSFNYYTFSFEHTFCLQTEFIEDEFQSSTMYSDRMGESLSYIEQNFKDDTYISKSITGSTDNFKVSSFDGDTDMYSSVTYLKNALQSVDIQKYNNNDIVYAIEDIDKYEITYYYNLLFIDQWDKIENDESEASLYFNDSKIELPYNSFIGVNNFNQVFLTASGGVPSHYEDMSLDDSTIIPPITYNEYLDLKSTVETEALKLIKEFNKENFSKEDERSNFVFDYLNKEKIEQYKSETTTK